MPAHTFTIHRRAIAVHISMLAALAAILLGQPASAQTTQPTTTLIHFRASSSTAERAAAIAALGGELVHWLPQVHAAEVLLPAGMQQETALASDAVQLVETNATVTGDLLADDPALADPEMGYPHALLGTSIAWSLSAGNQNVIVAVVDSGINANHPEFAGRVLNGYDFVNDDDDPADDHGHGTHVAGIIAAAVNNEQGTAGVCPGCSILPVKVLNAQNSSTWSTVARGILFAVDHGAQVINLSLGAAVSSYTLESAVDYAQAHGVVVVAAAGNAASTRPYYPAALDYVVAVSGTDPSDELWSFSNHGSYVDVAAPGQRVYSTYYDLSYNNGYAYMSGTSMASPFVAGLAGLLFSQDPSRTSAEVIALLTNSAHDLGPEGRDDLFGFGRVDAHRALVAGNGGVEPPPDVALGGGNDDGTGTLLAHAIYLPAVTR